ncbi:hypothetical protein [Micromonospora parathelypteridis]|uniref:Uncharacterized protein n=1 Tax=Micromonospora parathelypteridis TaxID=1839617 RepID=A0A840VZV0_9ACTN|nr:hypothetical protein [Micromonospora parathelypteridis]MBB5478498.1 hypothetical protein [Micromonospora parathelypteridis]
MSENAQQREPGRVDPDVLLDIPKVSVDVIRLAVDGLDADLSLRARVANLLQVDAGVRVHLSGGELDVNGVHAEAQLRVRLEQLANILGRALDTLDNNPQIIEALARTAATAVDDGHRGAQQLAGASARRSDGVPEEPGPEAGALADGVRPGRRHGERHHPAGQRPVGPGDGRRPAGAGWGAEAPAGSPTGQPRNRPDQSPAPGPSPSGNGDGGGGLPGGAHAAAQSAAQLAEQAGETLRQAGRSVWEAIQEGMAQHRQQGRRDQ